MCVCVLDSAVMTTVGVCVSAVSVNTVKSLCLCDNARLRLLSLLGKIADVVWQAGFRFVEQSGVTTFSHFLTLFLCRKRK